MPGSGEVSKAPPCCCPKHQESISINRQDYLSMNRQCRFSRAEPLASGALCSMNRHDPIRASIQLQYDLATKLDHKMATHVCGNLLCHIVFKLNIDPDEIVFQGLIDWLDDWFSQERLAWGTVTSTMRRAAHPSGCVRCGAGAGCSRKKHQSLCAGGHWIQGLQGPVGDLL